MIVFDSSARRSISLLAGGVLALALILLARPQPTQAANIHLRYFEGADVLLTDRTFQLFSLSALQDEQITIVAYGLEEGVTPSITLFDGNGRTILEDRNLDGLPASSVQVTIPLNCVYTFLVSRTSEQGGLIRVMLFAGDPLSDDLSFLDSIDPFLPNRAFLVAGDTVDPIEVSLEVLEDASADSTGIFAARGTQFAPPPMDERLTPRQSATWVNNDGDTFYTLHLSFFPEAMPPTSSKLGAHLARTSQTLATSTVQLNINEGLPSADPLTRPICDAVVIEEVTWLAGPSPQYRALDEAPLQLGRELEVVGENEDYYQVVNLNNPRGDGWIPKSALELGSATTGTDCSRVEFVMAPALTPETRR
jgi:hypothetical protein